MQFYGACTSEVSLMLVLEYMAGEPWEICPETTAMYVTFEGVLGSLCLMGSKAQVAAFAEAGGDCKDAEIRGCCEG